MTANFKITLFTNCTIRESDLLIEPVNQNYFINYPNYEKK